MDIEVIFYDCISKDIFISKIYVKIRKSYHVVSELNKMADLRLATLMACFIQGFQCEGPEVQCSHLSIKPQFFNIGVAIQYTGELCVTRAPTSGCDFLTLFGLILIVGGGGVHSGFLVFI